MIKDITIGRYYAVDSPVHRLDPRLKLICSLAYIAVLFIVDHPLSLIALSAFLFFVIGLSKVPIAYILKGIKPIMYIIIITVVLNLFMTNSGTQVFKFYFLRITDMGIIKALFMGFRLMILIMGSSLLTYTTSPIRLTDGIESLLNPLKVIKVPAHEIAMMMTIALRFIPTLTDETDKIMKAQMARGAAFDSKNIVKKAKSFLPLLVPLFISAFKRADDLALAMEARCYRGGEGRTRLKELKYGARDALAAFIFVAFFVCAIALDVFLKNVLVFGAI